MILKIEEIVLSEAWDQYAPTIKMDLRKKIARELLRRGLEAPANEVFEIIHMKWGKKGFVSAKPENATHVLIRLEQET